MLPKLDAHHESIMARMDSQLEKMEACLGKADINGFGGKSRRNKKSKTEHEAVHKEEDAAETLGTLKEQ
jgi:hypothetical protein